MQYDESSFLRKQLKPFTYAALNINNAMTDKYLKLMMKAQECTTRKKARKILKKVSKLTPTQLPPNENPTHT